MAKNLVIVESPAKAKTIEKFLGKVSSTSASARMFSATEMVRIVFPDFTEIDWLMPEKFLRRLKVFSDSLTVIASGILQ